MDGLPRRWNESSYKGVKREFAYGKSRHGTTHVTSICSWRGSSQIVLERGQHTGCHALELWLDEDFLLTVLRSSMQLQTSPWIASADSSARTNVWSNAPNAEMRDPFGLTLHMI